jgi:hypothetical protein
MANFSPTWQKVGFAAPNRRRTPHIKGKNAQKNLHPNAADFQLKKKEKRKQRKKIRKNWPLVLQHSRTVSSPIFSLVFHMDPTTFMVIK